MTKGNRKKVEKKLTISYRITTFLRQPEPRGATITQIQSHMLTVFGLKLKTTTQMVRELTLADTIKPN